MAQPVNHKLEYSALIGLFTHACRTPAKFARSSISGDCTREGFSLFAFFVKRSAKTTRMASTEEEFRQVSYFIYMHFNFLFLLFHL